MVGSIKKNQTKPAYERGEIDDEEIVTAQRESAANGDDRRAALFGLIRKAAKAATRNEDGHDKGARQDG